MSLLSLEQWRQQHQYNPWHFWGFAGALAPVSSQCNTVVRQYSWQSAGSIGRAEIQRSIEEAENRLRDQLNYAVAPHFRSEVLPYQQFYDPTLWAAWPVGSTGHWKTVLLGEGYVISCGVESLSLIATANVTYSDLDGDGLKETFSITAATTVTDPSEIAVYFSAADRWDSSPVGDQWRVHPVRVSIAGGVVTITGRAWMCGRPVLYEKYSPSDLDPAVVGNFATTLDIYRRECDQDGSTLATSQGKFIWDSLPFPTGSNVYGYSGSTDPNTYAYSIARVGVHLGIEGVVIPGEALYDAVSGTWSMTNPPWSGAASYRPPDKVEVRYFAGYPLDPSGQMASKFQTAVFRLSAAQLDGQIAACDEASRELARWQRDMSQVMDKTEGYRISDRDLDCPWGTRRGAIDAWRVVEHERQLRPVTTM